MATSGTLPTDIVACCESFQWHDRCHLWFDEAEVVNRDHIVLINIVVINRYGLQFFNERC